MKKNKWWIVLTIILSLTAYFSGFITGWIWPKRGQIGEFPQVDGTTRLLVVAPHPDDEVLIAGGLMQRVQTAGGQVKVLYLTSGDASISTVLKNDKKADLAPLEFLEVGRLRMLEAKKAMQVIGVQDFSFLGFPDQGLDKILHGKNVSATTKFDHVPYIEALYPGQKYSEENLVADIASVAASFEPTLVVTTHLRDTHPDHKAAYEAISEVRKETGERWDFYTALVHYKNYPMRGEFLFPPKKLFGTDWVSLELTEQERIIKGEAIKAYASQNSDPMQKNLYTKLTARNEIFERE